MNFMFFFALCAPIPVGVPDGTIVLVRDSNAIVEHIIKSRWTHIGVVFSDGENPWVYEAAPGGVRRVSLADFTRDAYAQRLGYRGGPSVYIMPPAVPFTDAETTIMQSFAQQQLGRRYSIKGLLRGRPPEGTNCAQFVAATLQQSGKIRFHNTFSQTPGTVIHRSRNLYKGLFRVPDPADDSSQSWVDATGRTFQDTREWLKWTTWEILHYWRD